MKNDTPGTTPQIWLEKLKDKEYSGVGGARKGLARLRPWGEEVLQAAARLADAFFANKRLPQEDVQILLEAKVGGAKPAAKKVAAVKSEKVAVKKGAKKAAAPAVVVPVAATPRLSLEQMERSARLINDIASGYERIQAVVGSKDIDVSEVQGHLESLNKLTGLLGQYIEDMYCSHRQLTEVKPAVVLVPKEEVEVPAESNGKAPKKGYHHLEIPKDPLTTMIS